MTKGEIIDGLYDIKSWECNGNSKMYEVIANAIKELEQESILDKIRAEIEQEQDDFMDDKDYDEGIRFGLMLAYQIIDKYRGEEECQEKKR